MSEIVLFTDPHLGLKRSVGVTSKSQKLYQQLLYDTALSIVESNPGVPKFCLGDLFDESSNNEDVILQGYSIASKCEMVLAGNHDVMNRADMFGSLHLVNKLFHENKKVSPVAISPNPGAWYFQSCRVGELAIFSIPHCFNQKIFEESLDKAAEAAACVKGSKALFLHCNVGDAFGKLEGGGSSLWLTEEMQEKALKVFDKILVGHEHEPKELHQGRLVILGNTFPVSYGEISPRFIYKMDTVTTELTKYPLFKVEDIYAKVDVGTFLELGGDFQFTQNLVEICGAIEERNLAALGRAMIKAWENNSSVCSIKKSVEIIRAKKLKAQKRYYMRNLIDLVRDAVNEAGFADEFGEIYDD